MLKRSCFLDFCEIKCQFTIDMKKEANITISFAKGSRVRLVCCFLCFIGAERKGVWNVCFLFGVQFFIQSLLYHFLLCRYDIKDKSKLTLQDIQFFAAMGPPGGGRNDVTPRFLRHFQVIGMNPFSDETMIKIFSTIMNAHLRVNFCDIAAS